MPQKNFDCNKCNGHHPRPINSKCKNVPEDSMGTVDRPEGQSMDMSAKILQELQSLSGRMSQIEDKVNNQQQSTPGMASPGSQASTKTSDPDLDIMTPTMEEALKKSTTIQAAVDSRLKELSTLSDKGKFKSQGGGGGGGGEGGGSETVWVKNEIPWPHNHVLSGSNKSRTSYDALSLSQWVAGFSCIVKEETDPSIKNHMLEYMTDLMEDSHDFGWAAAKASHAVLLCRMEEGKVKWGKPIRLTGLGRHMPRELSPLQLLQ